MQRKMFDFMLMADWRVGITIFFIFVGFRSATGLDKTFDILD
jgi:hypothetical protein